MKKVGIIIALLAVASTGFAFDWFGAMDKNKDGKITEAEWVSKNRATKKAKGQKFSEETAKKTFANRDVNKDGFISPAELK